MKKNVLIVDDDMMMRSIIEIYLVDQGFEIVGSAQDAEKALNLLKNNKVDIIILDIHLKGTILAIDFVEKINKEYNLPIIYISADPNEETITKSIRKNIYGYLQKPLHKNNLRSTIYFALAKHNLKNNKNVK